MTDTKQNPTPSPEDPVRHRIVSGARRHFFQLGFRSVTMEDLAKELGMSKKTLYVHFQSKRELLEAVIGQKLGDLERGLVPFQTENSEDFADVLQRLLLYIQSQSREITPPFLHDMAKEAPDLIEQVKARRRKFISETFGRILRVGQKSGAIRKDISVEMQVETLVGMVDAMVTPEKVAAWDMTPSEFLAIILSIFLNGIMTEKDSKKK